ncbi:alpha-amylase family protein [Paracoccus sp. WLY502]|uniref:alpha-amylase family protein n=1 Tax=Paracoccus yibinensis TaxID=3068891 RepID=UPI0027967466|nr:alpha-amylase family protein [Paracoccus sp. WLY502]MDQ1901894.1 alpha-amylase family protein [Paracoccus sp. WLY502]
MDISRTGDVWWKNAVFYCLDVETFQDSNGDGIGDFAGLTRRIDHLARLGVTCIWLMPFYPTANQDDGYDITDYYGVDPRLGTLGDLAVFLRMAKDRGIRVIADLVVNHTSDRHPWFISAASDRNSPYRDWYVWRDDIPPDGPSDLVFPDKEHSNWEWHEETGQYYLHRFYHHQPDLNIGNPKVREEIHRIVGFWLQLGLAGFRVDAVPFLLETQGLASPPELDMHDWLRDLRSFVQRRCGDAVLLGEVNLPYQDVRRFYGDEDGGELNMSLDFNMNQALALALVREDAGPLVHSLRAMPDLHPDDGWAHFARNHDEWSLDKLTEAERQQVFRAFGPDEEMQLFGRGLRRRIPTMLKGNEDRIRLVYSIVFALPGAPVLFYGEEIGMAENLDIPGRQSVRSPMQWTDGPNGGFSSAPEDQVSRPVVSGSRWGPKGVNVEAQDHDPGSLLNWMEGLIRRRREMPEIAFGEWSFIPFPDAAIFALRYDWGDRTALLLHNLGKRACTSRSRLEGAEALGRLTRIQGQGRLDLDADGTASLDLPGYGSLWLRADPADKGN